MNTGLTIIGLEQLVNKVFTSSGSSLAKTGSDEIARLESDTARPGGSYLIRPAAMGLVTDSAFGDGLLPDSVRCSDDLCLNFRNIHEVNRCKETDLPYCEFCWQVHVHGVSYEKVVGANKGQWVTEEGCKCCQERSNG